MTFAFASSPSIAKLCAALAIAQGKLKMAMKDKANDYFKSKYADLASVWDACREALAENGLSVIQLPRMTRPATVKEPEIPAPVKGDLPKPKPPIPPECFPLVSVVTVLAHSSGEWISSEIEARASKDNAQGVGAVITYLRRYALAAIVGIAQDDDDGETAVGRGRTEATFGHPINQEVPAAAKKAANAKETAAPAASSKSPSPPGSTSTPAAAPQSPAAPVSAPAVAPATTEKTQPAAAGVPSAAPAAAPAPSEPLPAVRTIKEASPCLAQWQKDFKETDIGKTKAKFILPLGISTMNAANPNQLQKIIDDVAAAYVEAKMDIPEVVRKVTSIPF